MKPDQMNIRRVIAASLSKGQDSHVWFFAARVQQLNIHAELKQELANGKARKQVTA